ncbi:MAG: bifunctional phosphoribosylaminoimidazolecarboxamide formyltransferase/IMP cyclohydrolase [Thermoplasmatales archaeon]
MQKNAVISTSDKSDLEKVSSFLINQGYDLFCTSGTRAYLNERGLKCESIEKITQTPEILGGRVKTLSFNLMAGILAKNRDDEQIKQFGITPVDLVYVEPYDFKSRFIIGDTDLVEFIDIGGITILRAAAKNFYRVIPVVGKKNMERVLNEMKNGQVSLELRKYLASEVFRFTSWYDYVVSEWFRGEGDIFSLAGQSVLRLRYGENPHQRAYAYSTYNPFFEMVKEGKEISFNNIMDAWSAWDLVLRLGNNSCSVVKHASPCGAAIGSDSYVRAYESDPVSAYGGVVAINGEFGESEAEFFRDKYVEVIIARDFSQKGLQILQRKKNLRVLKGRDDAYLVPEVRTAGNVILVQDWNRKSDLKMTVRTGDVSNQMIEDIRFGWEIVKSVKSNAIVIVKRGWMVSSCGGQPNRVDAVRIAVDRAEENKRISDDAILISDGFFPFPDSLEYMWSKGIRNVAAPTGSVRDNEVISLAKSYGMNFVELGERAFRH